MEVMMKKNRAAGLLAVSVLCGVFALTGCGQSKKEVEFFSSKPENAQIMQQLVDEFNETSGQEIKVVLNTPADAGTVLKTRMAKNDIPDIIAYGGDNTYTELQSAGVLRDLTGAPYLDTIQDAYMEMVYDVQKDRERVPYAVPYATNASGVLYNVDKFNELGLTVPKTWDEFMDVIKKIEDAGGTPFEFTFKDAWTLNCPWNSIAPDLAPEGFTDARLQDQTTFAETHQEIAEKYLELIKHGQTDIMGTTYDDGNKAFANGDAYMMINGNWAISQFTTANPDMHVDLFALPASNDSTVNYVTSGVDVLLCASAGSKYPEVVDAFLTFMMDKENNQKYIDDQFAFSPIEGVIQKDETVSGVMQDIADGKVANFPDHYYPSGFNLSAVLSEYAANYVSGMDDASNISAFLDNLDTKYDSANIQ